MNRLRRWLFRAIAMTALLLLAASIGAEVLARSGRDLWTYQVLHISNSNPGWSLRTWELEFAGGGVSIKTRTESNSTLVWGGPQHLVDEGQVHHEAYPAESMQVQRVPRDQ